MGKRLSMLAGVALLAFGCAAGQTGGGATASPAQKEVVAPITVPSAAIPPPGQCRYWFPGKEVALQPVPGDCDAVAGERKPNSWFLRRPADQPDQVLVVISNKLGVIVSRRVVSASSGREIAKP